MHYYITNIYPLRSPIEYISIQNTSLFSLLTYNTYIILKKVLKCIFIVFKFNKLTIPLHSDVNNATQHLNLLFCHERRFNYLKSE